MDSGTDNERKCLLIAPLENHATAGRVAALVGTAYSVAVADVSIGNSPPESCYPFKGLSRVYDLRAARHDPIYSTVGSGRRRALLLDLARSYRLLPENKAIRNAVREALTDSDPDVVVTFYGPIAIHYARIVRRIAPKIPIVLIVNLIPSTIVPRRPRWLRALRRLIATEFGDYRNWLHRVDGIVFASEEMRSFVDLKFPNLRAQKLIAPDYLPINFQGGGADPSPLADAREPRVIFFGAPERYGGAIDTVDEQFLELAGEGIDVYSAVMSAEALSHPRCHQYPRFSNESVFKGELAEYARAFDAAIVTYNLTERHERFRSTFPTRFFTSLAAGIPIAVKGGVFDACERFVTEHGNGFVYNSVAELASLLADRERMSVYRARADQVRKATTAESQSAELQRFLDSVVDRDRQRTNEGIPAMHSS